MDFIPSVKDNLKKTAQENVQLSQNKQTNKYRKMEALKIISDLQNDHYHEFIPGE